MKLINLSICNICYVREYTCEFSKYYYLQFFSNEDQSLYINLYYSKLPPPWSTYFINEFEKYKMTNIVPETLGSRIRFLNNRLSDICIQRSLLKNSRVVGDICCNKIEMPTQWGCHLPYKKKYSKKYGKRKYKKYKHFKKKYIKPNRKYYKKKRYKKQTTYNKKSFDKNKCKCWNCGEIGHLSTECNKKKVRILKEEFEDIVKDLEEINNPSDYENEEIFIEIEKNESESE